MQIGDKGSLTQFGGRLGLSQRLAVQSIMTSMSTELIEENLPDVGSRSVGIVRTQSQTLFAPPNPLVLTNSRKLGPITVAY